MEVPLFSAFCKVREASPEESLSLLWNDIRMYNLFSTVGQFGFFLPINWISAVEHFAAWGRPAQGMA